MKSKSRYRRAHSDWATRQLAIQQECDSVGLLSLGRTALPPLDTL